MKKQKIGCLLIILFVIIIMSACSLQENNTQGEQDSGQGNRPQPPSEFRNLENPLSSNETNIAKGKESFLTNCVSCHGENGMGDGVLSGSLDPKPVPFPLESVEDAYIYWRISEGGMREPFISVMPAWKTIISEEQIWQIVHYLRSL